MKTKAQKRVELARDVINQLIEKQIVATNGKYLGGRLLMAAQTKKYDLYDSSLGEEDLDMRDLIRGEFKGKSCQVCAKGALFIAHILRNDKVTLGEFIHTDLRGIRNGWNPIPAFTPRQLDEIEALFEGGTFLERGEWSRRQAIALHAAYKKIHKGGRAAEARLINIMKLIIRNKGQKVVL